MGFEQTGVPQYFLGGVPGLLAYGANEVRGDQYFLFRTGIQVPLAQPSTVRGGGFYGVGMYEIGKMYNAPGVSALPNDGAFGVITRTAFGPVFIGGSIGDTGHKSWFFSLGHLF